MGKQLNPGDLVKATKSDTKNIRKGSVGVVQGKRFGKIEVTFNPSTSFKKGRSVDTSGGPVRLIKREDIKSTGKKRFQTFKENGKNIRKKVDVFKTNL